MKDLEKNRHLAVRNNDIESKKNQKVESLHLYRTNKKKLASQNNSNSKIKIKTNFRREATLN